MILTLAALFQLSFIYLIVATVAATAKATLALLPGEMVAECSQDFFDAAVISRVHRETALLRVREAVTCEPKFQDVSDTLALLHVKKTAPAALMLTAPDNVLSEDLLPVSEAEHLGSMSGDTPADCIQLAQCTPQIVKASAADPRPWNAKKKTSLARYTRFSRDASELCTASSPPYECLLSIYSLLAARNRILLSVWCFQYVLDCTAAVGNGCRGSAYGSSCGGGRWIVCFEKLGAVLYYLANGS